MTEEAPVGKDEASASPTNDDDIDDGRLVGVKSITFKMEWSDPLYVSQNTDRDNLKVQLQPHMFELDSTIEVTETSLLEFKYDGKISQQVTDE